MPDRPLAIGVTAGMVTMQEGEPAKGGVHRRRSARFPTPQSPDNSPGVRHNGREKRRAGRKSLQYARISVGMTKQAHGGRQADRTGNVRGSKCGTVYPDLASFARDASKASGHKSICKGCDRAKAKRYYAGHREEKLERLNARNAWTRSGRSGNQAGMTVVGPPLARVASDPRANPGLTTSGTRGSLRRVTAPELRFRSAEGVHGTGRDAPA